MYGWEKAYAEQIEKVREKEIWRDRVRLFIRGFNGSFYLSTQGLASLGAFGTYFIWNE